MAEKDQNLDTQLAHTFKGVLKVIATDSYSMVELQELELSWGVEIEKHYTHTGKKKVVISGDNSRFRWVCKETADMYATEASDPPAPSAAEQLTASYILDQMITKRILPEINFDAIEETEASSPNFVHNQFKGVIDTAPKRRITDSGVYELEFEGEITEHTLSQLQAS